MPQIIPIKDLKNTSEISEGQVESGQVMAYKLNVTEHADELQQCVR